MELKQIMVRTVSNGLKNLVIFYYNNLSIGIHTHAQTYAQIDARKHARTHARTQKRTHKEMRANMHGRMHAHKNVRSIKINI